LYHWSDVFQMCTKYLKFCEGRSKVFFFRVSRFHVEELVCWEEGLPRCEPRLAIWISWFVICSWGCCDQPSINVVCDLGWLWSAEYW
jgi:hypothetical protein